MIVNVVIPNNVVKSRKRVKVKWSAKDKLFMVSLGFFLFIYAIILVFISNINSQANCNLTRVQEVIKSKQIQNNEYKSQITTLTSDTYLKHKAHELNMVPSEKDANYIN